MLSVMELAAASKRTLYPIEMPGTKERFFVRDDGRVVREAVGLCTSLVPAERDVQRLHGKKDPSDKTDGPDIVTWNRELMPSPAECKFISEVLFTQYKHETLCWWGRARADKVEKGKRGGWKKGDMMFFIPLQIVSAAHVSVRDKDEANRFMSVAQYMGDMHSHPWKGFPSRSHTDVADMEEGPGVHAIFSGDHKVVWYASVRGGHREIERWDLEKEDMKECALLTADGKSIDSRMIEPPKANIVYVGSTILDECEYEEGARYYGRHSHTKDTSGGLLGKYRQETAGPMFEGCLYVGSAVIAETKQGRFLVMRYGNAERALAAGHLKGYTHLLGTTPKEWERVRRGS